jgi:hypothetical protein
MLTPPTTHDPRLDAATGPHVTLSRSRTWRPRWREGNLLQGSGRRRFPRLAGPRRGRRRVLARLNQSRGIWGRSECGRDRHRRLRPPPPPPTTGPRGDRRALAPAQARERVRLMPVSETCRPIHAGPSGRIFGGRRVAVKSSRKSGTTTPASRSACSRANETEAGGAEAAQRSYRATTDAAKSALRSWPPAGLPHPAHRDDVAVVIRDCRGRCCCDRYAGIDNRALAGRRTPTGARGRPRNRTREEHRCVSTRRHGTCCTVYAGIQHRGSRSPRAAH